MVTHSWPWFPSSRERFGAAWGAVVVVELRSQRGLFVPMHAIIDSGAPFCIFGARACEPLGLDPALGRKEQVGRVAGTPFDVRVMEVELRVRQSASVRLPIGFTDKPNWPNLIGRLGFFDAYRVTFDPVRRETRVQGSFGKWGEN